MRRPRLLLVEDARIVFGVFATSALEQTQLFRLTREGVDVVPVSYPGPITRRTLSRPAVGEAVPLDRLRVVRAERGRRWRLELSLLDPPAGASLERARLPAEHAETLWAIIGREGADDVAEVPGLPVDAVTCLAAYGGLTAVLALGAGLAWTPALRGVYAVAYAVLTGALILDHAAFARGPVFVPEAEDQEVETDPWLVTITLAAIVLLAIVLILIG